MSTSVEKELRAAAKYKGTDLGKLIDIITELQDEQWEKVSKPSQDWYNEAVIAMNYYDNDPSSIPAFPDDVEEAETDQPEEEESKMTTKAKSKSAKPAAAKTKNGAAPAKAKAADKPAKAAKSDTPKATSMRRTIKQIIVKDPLITVDKLVERLEKAGHKPSKMTVAAIRASTRDTMKVMLEAGLYKGNV